MLSGKVVVRTSLSIESLKNGSVYAAHLNGMGLTAYGRAPSEAREAVKRLFKVWVDGYRKLGVLEARLDRIGADWRPYEDYRGDVPVEDVAPSVTPPSAKPARRSVGTPQETAWAEDQPVAMAA